MSYCPLLSSGDVTTAANGAATGYIECPNGGLLLGLSYVKDETTPYDNGVQLIATVDQTAAALVTVANMNASVTKYPRALEHATANGADLLTYTPIPIAAGHRIKLAISSGGDTKKGAFFALLG